MPLEIINSRALKNLGGSLKSSRSLFYLFADSPARREDFIKTTKSGCFPHVPKPFCAARWLDDLPVAHRAIEIWTNIVKYVAKKAKSKIPGCESFKVVLAATSDPFTVARLEFLVFTAKQLEPFLRKYQTDWPVILFLAGDLEALLRGLLGRIIKTGKMVAASVTNPLDTDMKSTKNALSVKQVEIGFGAKSVLQKIPREKVN